MFREEVPETACEMVMSTRSRRCGRVRTVAGLGRTRAGTAGRFQPGAVAPPPSTRPDE